MVSTGVGTCEDVVTPRLLLTGMFTELVDKEFIEVIGGACLILVGVGLGS